jgi:hypothetical protein
MTVKHIKASELKDGMKVVGFMDKRVEISRVRVSRDYVYFYNEYLGTNDRLSVYADVPVEVEDEVEKLYLVCNSCGEAFDEIQTAHEHGASDPQSKTWCGDDGFVIAPESEAL